MSNLYIHNDSLGGNIAHDMGARFIKGGTAGTETFADITITRFSDFLLSTVATRRLPVKAEVETPRVVVKMDIEGLELDLVPDLFMTGGFNVVDNLHGEWHDCRLPQEDCDQVSRKI